MIGGSRKRKKNSSWKLNHALQKQTKKTNKIKRSAQLLESKKSREKKGVIKQKEGNFIIYKFPSNFAWTHFQNNQTTENTFPINQSLNSKMTSQLLESTTGLLSFIIIIINTKIDIRNFIIYALRPNLQYHIFKANQKKKNLVKYGLQLLWSPPTNKKL